MDKIVNFIKLRLIEITGLILVATGIFIFYSLITYSPANPTIIFPENADPRALLIRYGSSFADFILQTFGLIAFGLCMNFMTWGAKLGLDKKIANIWFLFLFVVFYLIFGSAFFKIYNDQSFWLPDHGNGGFLGSYIIDLFGPFAAKIKIFSFIALLLSIIFFIVSLGFSFSNWKSIIKNLTKPFYLITKNLFRKKSEIKETINDDFISNTIINKTKKILSKKFNPVCLCRKILRQNLLSTDCPQYLF